MKEIAVKTTENEELFILKKTMAKYGWKSSLLRNKKSGILLLVKSAVAPVYVLKANNNDVNLVETRTVHFS